MAGNDDLLNFFVLVHSGSGSMSECASPRATFGPYDRAEAEAVKVRIEDASSGFDDGLHARVLDTSKAKADPTEFISTINS
jgi:hypothetical protein